MNNKNILSVKQLNTYIKLMIEADTRLQSVYLRAEISNFTNHYKSGHFYLTLKDEDAVVRAVMFKSSAIKLKFTPQDGMKIIAKGRVSVFERDGQYQFYIDDMIPDGEGALHIAFEQLKQKLSAEGLFDEYKKKPIPKIPAKIGVITSPTGAAIRDIIHILGRRMPITKVILYPVLVQGDLAPKQIIEAIAYFHKENSADVLIVGRGGGSLEELWAFNDEGVARAIYASEIPIISAVGHETDFTIADFVADLRAPTPSAAAELAVPDSLELMQRFDSMVSKLKILLVKELNNKKDTLKRYVLSPVIQNPMRIVDEKRLNLDYLVKSLSGESRVYIGQKREKTSIVIAKLNALSPLSVLSRGYSMALDKDSNILKSVKGLKKEDHINIKFSDGTAFCMVENIKGDKKNGK
jgi:exodeoxyribonuclease VII large subunit